MLAVLYNEVNEKVLSTHPLLLASKSLRVYNITVPTSESTPYI